MDGMMASENFEMGPGTAHPALRTIGLFVPILRKRAREKGKNDLSHTHLISWETESRG